MRAGGIRLAIEVRVWSDLLGGETKWSRVGGGGGWDGGGVEHARGEFGDQGIEHRGATEEVFPQTGLRVGCDCLGSLHNAVTVDELSDERLGELGAAKEVFVESFLGGHRRGLGFLRLRLIGDFHFLSDLRLLYDTVSVHELGDERVAGSASGCVAEEVRIESRLGVQIRRRQIVVDVDGCLGVAVIVVVIIIIGGKLGRVGLGRRRFIEDAAEAGGVGEAAAVAQRGRRRGSHIERRRRRRREQVKVSLLVVSPLVEGAGA